MDRLHDGCPAARSTRHMRQACCHGAALLVAGRFASLRNVSPGALRYTLRSSRRRECLHGICSAHWAALQSAIQIIGGLPHSADALHSIAVDLHAINNSCAALREDAALAAIFSCVIADLTPSLREVSFWMLMESDEGRC